MTDDLGWIDDGTVRALRSRHGDGWEHLLREFAGATGGWAALDDEGRNALALEFARQGAGAFDWLDVENRDYLRGQYGDEWDVVLAGYLDDTWGADWTSFDDDTKNRMWTELTARTHVDDPDVAEEPAVPTDAEVEAYLRGELDIPEHVERLLLLAVERGTLVAEPA
ncbi:hypothetical protein [Umezawaea sp. Da 62-37]|uniref:hypothetical protein n=1 Tax=Umezawaea sp. Da 62-37 TaxID=3075927 RepID=UPI0028F70586|nr:hypothetical protein [Umezawaea sp. Da 62-37]WNV87934.1 hypothetical protein RM788_06510 [Umezawaea sp. Da 62-37]